MGSTEYKTKAGENSFCRIRAALLVIIMYIFTPIHRNEELVAHKYTHMYLFIG